METIWQDHLNEIKRKKEIFDFPFYGYPRAGDEKGTARCRNRAHVLVGGPWHERLPQKRRDQRQVRQCFA